MKSRRSFLLALVAVAGFLAAPSARAGDLAEPQGDVILTVSGAIANSNGDGLARFDMALLDGLPRHSFATSTIWTEGVNTYEGVLLKMIREQPILQKAQDDSLLRLVEPRYKFLSPPFR